MGTTVGQGGVGGGEGWEEPRGAGHADQWETNGGGVDTQGKTKGQMLPLRTDPLGKGLWRVQVSLEERKGLGDFLGLGLLRVPL